MPKSKPKASVPEIIRTIEDDEEVEDYSEESDGEVEVRSRNNLLLVFF